MVNDVVRIFVSSPSDLGFERSRAERVAERLSGLFDGVKIVPYRWESGQYFSAHTNFQDAIPEVEAFDIVIGLFWSRLGTPLPASYATMPDGRPYPSGTAFEILRAIEHRRKPGQGKPDVFVYRKMAGPPPVPPDDMVGQQAQLERLAALNAFIAEWFVNEADGFKAAFSPFNTTDDFEAMLESHLRTWLRDNRRLGRERRWRVEERGAPFRGLEAFEAEHRDVFFGRRADIERGRERLGDAAARGTPFLLIEGASGTGKSSLARAGLLPRLTDLDPDARVARMRPEGAPIDALARALVAALPELSLGDYQTPEALARHLANGGDPGPVLRALDRAAAAQQQKQGTEAPPALRLYLLLDQAEEVFAPSLAPEVRRRFADLIAALARSGRIWVIATLRADARAAALADPAFAGLIDSGAALTLSPPGAAALADIIRAPAEAAGLSFDRQDGVGLDEALIAEAQDTAALPLLQFLLMQLYDRAVARVRGAGQVLGDVDSDQPVATLSFADFHDLGGIAGAVRAQAEAAFAGVSAAAQATLPRLVRALTEPGPGGLGLRDAPLAEAADPDTAALVDALVAARILARDDAHIRFCHARVIGVWDRAAEAARSGAAFLRIRAEVQAAQAKWQAQGRRASLLLPRGVPLAEATTALADHADELPDDARRYIRASRARARRGQSLTAAAALVFAGVAGLAIWQTDVALRSEAEAQAAQAQAQSALHDATAAANMLIFDLAQKLKDQGLPTRLAREILDEAQRLQAGLIANFPHDAPLQRSRSAALNETGELLIRQGDTTGALRAYGDALAIARALAARDPGAGRDVAVSLARLGDALAGMGDPAARPAFAEAATIYGDLVAATPADASLQRDQAAAWERLGSLDLAAGNLGPAREAYGRVLSVYTRLTTADPANADWQRGLWVAQARLGDLAIRAGDGAAARAAFGASLDLARDLAARDPARTDWQRDLSLSLTRLAEIDAALGDLAAARTGTEAALAIQRRLAAADPGNLGWARDLGVGLGKTADLALARADAPTALAASGEALQIAARLADSDPGNPGWQRDLIASLAREGDLRRRTGDAPAARRLADQAVATARKLAAQDATGVRDLAAALTRSGDLARHAGDAATASAAYVEALELARSQAQPDTLDVAMTLMKLADVTRGAPRRAALTDALAILGPLAGGGKLSPDQARWPDRLRAALAQDTAAQ